MTYELPISADYVPDWGVWEACRELIQNSIDAIQEDDRRSMIFEYEPLTETLKIGCTDSTLEPRTLLIGSSSKRDDKTMIGKHGEGYKLAFLVLKRNLIDVEVRTGSHKWECEFVHNDKYGEHVLHVNVMSGQQPSSDVVFTLSGITQDMHAEVCANWLPDCRASKILDAEYLSGRIFVGGLFVCEANGFECGYNFAPGVVRLDRDRRLVDSFDVSYHAGELWAKAASDRLYKQLQKTKRDTSYVGTHISEQKATEIFELYSKDYPGTVPIDRQEDQERFRGQKTRIVAPALRIALHKGNRFKHSKPTSETSCKDVLKSFYAKAQWSLSDDLCRDFEAIIEDSDSWSRA